MSATAILKLSQAGFTDDQVTALAEYFDEQMATKADIAAIEADIAELKTELKYDIEKIRADLSSEIARVRADLELKIADAKADTIKWVAGLMVAQGAAIVALIRFLPGIHS